MRVWNSTVLTAAYWNSGFPCCTSASKQQQERLFLNGHTPAGSADFCSIQFDQAGDKSTSREEALNSHPFIMLYSKTTFGFCILYLFFFHLTLRFLRVKFVLFFLSVLRSITSFQTSSCSTSLTYWHTNQYGIIYVIKSLLGDLLIAVVNDEPRSCDFLITNVRLNDRTGCGLSFEVLQKEVIFNGRCVLL